MGRIVQIICGGVLALGLMGAQPVPKAGQPNQAPQNRQAASEPRPQVLVLGTEGKGEGGEDERKAEDERYWLPVADLWAQIAMALFALGQLGLTALGIVFIRRTLDATKDAVVEAGNATEAAREAVEVTRVSAEQQLRAYMMIDSLHISGVSLGERPSINFQLKNSGQTPATDAAIAYAIRLDAYPLTVVPPLPHIATEPSRALVQSGGALGKSITLDEPLNAAHFAALRQSRFAVYFILECTYSDIFRRERTTRVAMFYNETSGPIERHGIMSHLPIGNWFT